MSVIVYFFVRFFCMSLSCIETLFFRLKMEEKYVNQTKQDVCLSTQRHFQVQKNVWKFFWRKVNKMFPSSEYQFAALVLK